MRLAFNEYTIAGSQIPWVHREFIGGLEGYWRTIYLVLFKPKRFAEDGWRTTHLSEGDARLFQWITLPQGLIPLLVIFGYFAFQKVQGARFALLMACAALLLWLWLRSIISTVVFLFRVQNLDVYRLERVTIMSRYTCAALALTPLHLLAGAAILLLRQLPGIYGTYWQVALLLWTLFLLFQIGLYLNSAAVLARETMKSDAGDMFVLALVAFLGWLWATAVYLVSVPLLAWWVNDRLLHWF
jgi:hypothetical protein